MIKIKLLKDYVPMLANKGDIRDIDDNIAVLLVERGIAEKVKTPKPKAKALKKPATKRPTRGYLHGKKF